ncbi:hypothetical protein TTHERM_00323090 (macronuclear) [Tetrahymena thermophila SB210]|uniref:Transmembrane protein n=1 Tax=Tetrahymena thermophila (strain SB210) TaxID=312017 RepID=Q237H6_TETTS|nr:hypothetical protein TTHERM_00323090 [Tetrahymena thermophila SB210]EAR92765.1 hypothetical protein TTHERM_00323090 [Tetrahymena thermophila SB210]|eukprot:XP_001013010.1 hypothetical protein TTHERM_00323090 [Tetrahymena thermophila SB210]
MQNFKQFISLKIYLFIQLLILKQLSDNLNLADGPIQTQNLDRSHGCFFKYKYNNEIDDQYLFFQPVQDQKKLLWNQINNGLKYSLIFDYIFFQRMVNINPEQLSQKYQVSYLELFIRYPGNNEIYNHVKENCLHKYYQAEAITNNSQITIDLNQSLLYQNWQKQFHKYLIQNNNNNKFQQNIDDSFDFRMKDKKMFQKIQKRQEPKLWSRDWFFISKLSEFKADKNMDILLGSSGCGPLIRSVGFFEAVKELVIEFRDNHFVKIINAYFGQGVEANQLIDQVHKLTSKKQQEQIKYEWEKYLNIKTNFGSKIENKKEILENHIMLLYYCLFYQNENGYFNWEDPNFFNYLLQQRGCQIRFLNRNIYYPHHNTKTFRSNKFMSIKKFTQLLLKPYVINFEQYSPDVLFLVFHILSKDNQSNRDIFDILLDTSQMNLYSQSHGPILATILSSYDFNYHENYINQSKNTREDLMNHFQRINLNAFDAKNQLSLQQYDKVLSSVQTQISTVQHAPDDLFLALHNNQAEIFFILLGILSLNFNQHCQGPILATILSSYDFNYHENYVNSNKKNRDDFINHFQRMDLNALDIKNAMHGKLSSQSPKDITIEEE